MSKVFPSFPMTFSGLDTSKYHPGVIVNYSVERASTDPYFYASIDIKNMVVGSRYWIAQESDHSVVSKS